MKGAALTAAGAPAGTWKAPPAAPKISKALNQPVVSVCRVTVGLLHRAERP